MNYPNKIRGAGTEKATDRKDALYICLHCFSVFKSSGTCTVCSSPVHEFHPGDFEDPCRCPVIDERGEVVTHAPLWWLREVEPELAKRIEAGKRRIT
jgi:hypothetical protein